MQHATTPLPHPPQSIRVSNVEVRALSFSDDGRYIIVGCADGSTCVLEADTGKKMRQLMANASGIVSVYFEKGSKEEGKSLADMRAVAVCSRQR